MSDELQDRAVEVRLLQVENAELRKRLADLEAVKTPAADRDGLDMLHRRIDKLADRVAMLERVRWTEEGEL